MSISAGHRPLIVGTAGHIDHGKTALIKMITGVDTDRLKQEKERGITIELGFASLDLPSGLRLGVVDVPGHERFVRNMLAGAGGIDLILFVIAADEGVMPQTREHMEIIDLLGVEHGVVALTKTDLVESDFLEIVVETVAEYLAETCLAGAPVVGVSSTTGEGRDELLRALDEVAARVQVRERGNLRRLPIDRVFTMEGFGTVVTGTLWAGRLRDGESVRVLPGEITTRIKSLEVHNVRVPEALAGQRTAVLLHAVEKRAIQRGDWVVAGEEGAATTFVDARLRVLASAAKPLENGQRIRFHLGAAEIIGRVFLLEVDELRPGEKGWAQLRLEAPVLTERGDHFVLRTYSPMATIAGGVVVTAGVGRRRRFRREDIEALEQAERGTPAERVLAVIVRHSARGADAEALARESGCTAAEVGQAVTTLAEGGRAQAVSRKLVVTTDALIEAGVRMQRDLETYQQRTPLSWGLLKSELKKRSEQTIHADVVEAWVRQESEAGRLFPRNDRLRYGSDRLELSPEMEAQHQAILSEIHGAAFAGRRQVEILHTLKAGGSGAGGRTLEPKEAEALLFLLVDSGEIVRVPPDFFFARDRMEELAQRVRVFYADHEEMRVADLKEMIGVSRKQAVPLLEYLDQNRLTMRRGDVRLPGPRLLG
ncbi:MAG: selenocysteine-specific translation elongation factor [Candidatus Eisenbacteria sp.]|nr:selenocysteine-specific translation elongation factor [Candidatus Eisenbacteria bacterium]